MKRPNKKHRSKVRQIPEELIDTLNNLDKSFHKLMHRPPIGEDRLFHWPYCYSEAELKNLMIHAMLQANLPERLIFIFDKTGFAANEIGYGKLSKSEKEEIKKAVQQYERKAKKKRKLYNVSDYDSNHIDDDGPVAQATYILGNFVERNTNSGQIKLDEQGFVISYLVIRAFRLVRALLRSFKFNTSEECFVLLRSLYEIYLKMLFAISSPENAKYLWDCDFGLVSGDFEVYKKEGKIKWSVLVNKVTGKTIPRNLSFQKMAENSPFVGDSALFNVIYEYLSSFVHSGSRHVFKAWKNERIGFELVNDQDEHILGFISILTSFICALLMQAMSQLKGVSRVSLWDMNLYCFAMRQVALDISTPKESEIAQLVEKMIARAGAFPNKVLPLDIDDPALK